MASVFTFEPEPPKLTSPWGALPTSSVEDHGGKEGSESRAPVSARQIAGLIAPEPLLLADCGLSRLEFEPQEGPTEYKLHLLLRPRRSFLMVSTSEEVSGSQQGRQPTPTLGVSSSSPETSKRTFINQMSAQPTTQTRQNRLQHLTTQLLWRLQQSSPYHSSTTADLIIPQLPEASPRLGAPLRPQKLLPGLESSRGALYEIGVADGGSFIGLTEDEMSESLTNLRAMAASLGCSVEIVRLVIVGDCEWITNDLNSATGGGDVRKDALLVAEAQVVPDVRSRFHEDADSGIIEPKITNGGVSRSLTISTDSQLSAAPLQKDLSRTQQLRVSLTGRTTAGKSSLLGTISTSTLDNGRGKSRLSLLKHRHEIATGVTSSVAPELIGYTTMQENGKVATIVNYSCGNISSWDDIHNATNGSRLVFITDSAGHPRYRRTIVRGLVSWAPHWTLCCIPADEDIRGTVSSFKGNPLDESNGKEDITRSSFAHLSLCLRLRLPVVVVITKHDHATKEKLRQTLSGVLSMIKAYGKHPNLMIRPGSKTQDLGSVSAEDDQSMSSALEDEHVVPIVLVSAVSGSGMNQLHALLYNLPIQQPELPPSPTPHVLFHVDEVYTLPNTQKPKNLVVLSGYLRYGSLSVGDIVHIGPFMAEARDVPKTGTPIERTRSNPSKTSTNLLPKLSQSTPRWEYQSAHTPPPSTPGPLIIQGEFETARVASIRNLRLPIRTLLQDQVGTIGIEFSDNRQTLVPKLRKGMVLARTSQQVADPQDLSVDPELKACTAIQVRFHEEDYEIMEPGAIFNVYVASVRTVAKIATVEAVSREAMVKFFESQKEQAASQRVFSQPDSVMTSSISSLSGLEDGAFGDLEDSFHEFGLRSEEDVAKDRRMIDVVFHFLYYPEWIECGAKVLAMPGHAIAGGIGLDGFVGQVVETFE